jgi:hypothetical protein
VVDDRSLLRRYLLGELDESEREDVETKLMTSNEHFQELLIAEDELVDDYCAGKLGAREEKAYRKSFLITPERLHQHRFGAALRKHISATGAEEALPLRTERGRFTTAWKLSLAAAVVVALLAATLWSLRTTQRIPVRLHATGKGAATGTTVAFFLPPPSLRSFEPEAEPTLNVPDGVAIVELQLGLPNDASEDHDVTLEEVRSDTILAEGRLPARSLEGQRVVVVPVPSALLAPGDYRVILREATTGSAVVETYAFRVTVRR